MSLGLIERYDSGAAQYVALALLPCQAVHPLTPRVIEFRHVEKPTPLAVMEQNIPAELKSERRWVLWNYEWVNGEWTKPLYAVTAPSRKADTTKSATWGSFADALGAYEDGKCDGIGFVLGDGWAGLDIDTAPTAEGFDCINTLDSYTETSPSGRGVHVLVRGAKPGADCKSRGIELYDHSRYFTVTGQHWAETPTTVEERTAELAIVYATLFDSEQNGGTGGTGGVAPTDCPKHFNVSDIRGKENITDADVPATVDHLTDDDLIALASTAANGEKFTHLWAGRWSGYPSQSEADAALCGILAFWTQRDPARIDRLFRRGGLMREKWNARRGSGTYGTRTISRSISHTTEIYTPSEGPVDMSVPTADFTDSIDVVEIAVELAPAPAVKLYSFEQAFPPTHFVGQWIDHFSKQCDAAFDFHEAAALVALAQATPRLTANISGSASGLRTNLYVLFLGDAGRSRKSTAKDYARETLQRALPSVLLPEQMTQESLVESLAKCNGGAALWTIDEFTDTLSKMLSATHLAGMRGLLLEMYSRTNYTYKRVSKKIKKKADDAGDVEREEDEFAINNVTLSLLGCATPTIFQTLDNTAVGSGLLSRFAIIMPESKPPRMRQYELKDDEVIPLKFIQWLHRIHERTENASAKFPEEVLKRLDDAVDMPLDESSDRCEMTVRCGVMARKIAMLSAAGRETNVGVAKDDPLVVTLADAEAAIRVVKRWIRYAKAFEARTDESAFEVKVQRCLAVVKGRTVPRRVIAQNVHMPAKELGEIEKTLQLREQIEVVTTAPKVGRPSVAWKWIG